MKHRIFAYTTITVISLFVSIACQIVPTCGPFPDMFKTIGISCTATQTGFPESEINFHSQLQDTVDYHPIYNEVRLLIEPQQETYYSINKDIPIKGFFSEAIACSPPDPTTIETIDSIKIVCNVKFDSLHPQGSDISSLFLIESFDSNIGIWQDEMTVKDFCNLKPRFPNYLTLLLMSPPTYDGEYIFTVKVYFDGVDYNYLESTCDPVFIGKT